MSGREAEAGLLLASCRRQRNFVKTLLGAAVMRISGMCNGGAAVSQAVEGQTSPDYAPSLGAIAKELQAVGTNSIRSRLHHHCGRRLRQSWSNSMKKPTAGGASAREAQTGRQDFEHRRETLAHIAYPEDGARRDRYILRAVSTGTILELQRR